jgi:hypothetical protein
LHPASAEPATQAGNPLTCRNSTAWTHAPQAAIFCIRTSSADFRVQAVGLLRNPGSAASGRVWVIRDRCRAAVTACEAPYSGALERTEQLIMVDAAAGAVVRTDVRTT